MAEKVVRKQIYATPGDTQSGVDDTNDGGGAGA